MLEHAPRHVVITNKNPYSFRLKIGRKKTEVMVCYKDFEIINIKMDDNALKQEPQFKYLGSIFRPPLWSSGQSFWLQIQRSRVRFPALPHFLSSSGSGTGSAQPREVN